MHYKILVEEKQIEEGAPNERLAVDLKADLPYP